MPDAPLLTHGTRSGLALQALATGPADGGVMFRRRLAGSMRYAHAIFVWTYRRVMQARVVRHQLTKRPA